MKLLKLFYFDIEKPYIRYATATALLLIGLFYTLFWIIFVPSIIERLLITHTLSRSSNEFYYDLFFWIIIPTCQSAFYLICAYYVFMNMLEYYYIYFLTIANLLITTGIILIDILLDSLNNHGNELFDWRGLWKVIDLPRLYTSNCYGDIGCFYLVF